MHELGTLRGIYRRLHRACRLNIALRCNAAFPIHNVRRVGVGLREVVRLPALFLSGIRFRRLALDTPLVLSLPVREIVGRWRDRFSEYEQQAKSGFRRGQK